MDEGLQHNMYMAYVHTWTIDSSNPMLAGIGEQEEEEEPINPLISKGSWTESKANIYWHI